MPLEPILLVREEGEPERLETESVSTVLSHMPVATSVIVDPAPGDLEVAEMIREFTTADDDPTLKVLATKLFENGYTVAVVARKLKLRPSTIWKWKADPSVSGAMEAGRLRRKAILGDTLQVAAENALSTLLDVMSDDASPARDRIKAAECVLDRSGLVKSTESEGQTMAVSVNVDFDERLAQIVAASKG